MNPLVIPPPAAVKPPPVYVNQNLINLDANIAFVDDIWNQRYNGKHVTHDVAHTNRLRAEYHKLFNCISRSQKIMKKLAKERKFVNELISCKERSVPEMADLVGNLSKRIPSTQALPYLWNHDEQREIIHNLNIKWEDMLLHDYLTSVLPDDDESDNEMSFDDKYGIVKTPLSEISMSSLGSLFHEHRALKEKNERLKHEVLALEREERQLQKSLMEGVTELMLPFSTMTMTTSIEEKTNQLFPLVQRSSSSRVAIKCESL